MAKFILSATMALVLAGCGGGDEPPAATPPTTLPTQAPPIPGCTPRVVSVAIEGDSTNYAIDGAKDLSLGWEAARAEHSPGVELQADMDAKFGPGAVVVTNYAVPGTTAAESPWLHADVIIENYGLNDMARGVPLADYAASIMTIGATIVETQIPTAYNDPTEVGYVNTVRGLGIQVADVYSYVQSLPNWRSYYPKQVSVHVSDQLYKMITDNVLAPMVAKQVAPLRCVAG